jgi:hypothetical protein
LAIAKVYRDDSADVSWRNSKDEDITEPIKRRIMPKARHEEVEFVLAITIASSRGQY